MKKKDPLAAELPLFFPRSTSSTLGNKTGSWRYFRPLYAEKTAPCSAACPLGEDIPRIEMLATQGLLMKAWEIILEENPLPSVCGRVCFHPCEKSCNRGGLDEPIAIHTLERFIGDTAIATDKTPVLKSFGAGGKKIAIAGAGPAGLAAGYFLSRLGYHCDIFEAQNQPGGILRWGIPDYRLPPDVLRQEITRIQNQGVQINCETRLTEKLVGQIQRNYDALFIGCGYARPIALKIPGESLLQDGLQFLQDIRSGSKRSFEGRTAVIGGGNTAIDVARTLCRLGASPTIMYRRRRQDMPAFKPEIEMALDEGVQLRELVAPVRIEKSRGRSATSGCAVTLQKMKISTAKIQGRARVMPDGINTETLRFAHAFRAIGAEPDQLWRIPAKNQRRHIVLSHCRLIEGKRPLVFGGDLTNAIKSVADAIASGKQAAMALDIYFNKGWRTVATELENFRVGSGPALSMAAYLNGRQESRNTRIVAFEEINTDYFIRSPRVAAPSLSADQSRRSFSEIETTLSKKAAVREAERCFNCGRCTACDYCRIFCPELAVTVEKERRFINLDYCKGCGICVTECPRNAMALEEEKK